MNCQTALEFLDCARPNSDDLDLPDLADARAHMDSCDDCRREFEERLQFDAAVSAVARDVKVPDGLRTSLLESLAQDSPTVDSESAASEQPAQSVGSKEARLEPKRRSRTAAMAGVAACIMLIAATAWLWRSQPEQFTVNDLFQKIELDLSDTSDFDQGFAVRTPMDWTEGARLMVQNELRGLDLDTHSGHDAAAAMFRFSPRRNAPSNGLLVVLPAERVDPLPVAKSFARAAVSYPRKGIVAVAWQENDRVFVCLFRGNASQLQRMQNALQGMAA